MVSIFRSRRTLTLFLLAFTILSLAGLSFAYYIGDIIGNRNNTMLLHTIDYGNITVSYPETNGTINMGNINLDDDNLSVPVL